MASHGIMASPLGHCSHLYCGLPGSTLAPSASSPSSTLHQGQPLKDTKLVVFFLCLKFFRPLGHKPSSQALRAIQICYYLASFPIVPWVPSCLLFTPYLHIPHVHQNQTMWISLERFLHLTVFMSARLEHLLTCPWGEMFKIESSSLRSLPVLPSAPPSTHRMNHSSALLLYTSTRVSLLCPWASSPCANLFSTPRTVPGGHHISTTALKTSSTGWAASRMPHSKCNHCVASTLRTHCLPVIMVSSLDTIIYKTKLWVPLLWKCYHKVEGLGENRASQLQCAQESPKKSC